VRIPKLAALGIAGALVLSACGSDGGDGDDAAPSDGSGAATEEEATIRLWLNGPDTPDEMVDFAIATFEEEHPGVDVQFERQEWTGIVERLTTALSSDDGPDVVELGNTQAQAFEAAGALLDLTDRREELGGDDFLQSLVEAGTYDGHFYGVPYYAGARIVVYRTDLFEEAGLEIPTTLDEFIEAGAALQQANSDVPNFSGIYFPGRYWYAALPFIWEAGGDIAVQDSGQWEGTLASDESVAGLEMVQRIMTEASNAPADGDESQDHIAFCNGEVGMLMGPGWKVGQILGEEDGCPEMEGKIGAFAMPGTEPGTTAPVFLGGSNLAVSANSAHPDLAVDLLAVMVGDEYQQQFAELGVLPARLSLLDQVTGDEAAQAQAEAAANSRFVPSSENWAAVESAAILPDMLVAIAQGGDVRAEAERADQAIAAALNGGG
jgi:N,N'-diacetylchitobiose transport system substrate-binding protein